MYCRNCLYQLEHLDAARCPECGHAFNPADPESYLAHPLRPVSQLRVLLGAGIALVAGGFALLLAGRILSVRFIEAGAVAFVAGLFAVAFAAAGGAGTAGRDTCPPLERAEAKKTAVSAVLILVAVLVVPLVLFTLMSLLGPVSGW